MVVRRPHDRKQQILAAAGELFREHGYHNVSVAQVAAAVGITAPALYRHFKNKPDLLYAAVNAGIESLYDRVAGSEDLKSLIAELAASVSRRRGLSLLWQREARYLPDEQREEMRATLKSAAARDAALIRTERPELDEEDSYLLAWLSLPSSTACPRIGCHYRDVRWNCCWQSWRSGRCIRSWVTPRGRWRRRPVTFRWRCRDVNSC